jgi:hypothetical protein
MRAGFGAPAMTTPPRDTPTVARGHQATDLRAAWGDPERPYDTVTSVRYLAEYESWPKGTPKEGSLSAEIHFHGGAWAIRTQCRDEHLPRWASVRSVVVTLSDRHGHAKLRILPAWQPIAAACLVALGLALLAGWLLLTSAIHFDSNLLVKVAQATGIPAFLGLVGGLGSGLLKSIAPGGSRRVRPVVITVSLLAFGDWIVPQLFVAYVNGSSSALSLGDARLARGTTVYEARWDGNPRLAPRVCVLDDGAPVDSAGGEDRPGCIARAPAPHPGLEGKVEGRFERRVLGCRPLAIRVGATQVTLEEAASGADCHWPSRLMLTESDRTSLSAKVIWKQLGLASAPPALHAMELFPAPDADDDARPVSVLDATLQDSEDGLRIGVPLPTGVEVTTPLFSGTWIIPTTPYLFIEHQTLRLTLPGDRPCRSLRAWRDGALLAARGTGVAAEAGFLLAVTECNGEATRVEASLRLGGLPDESIPEWLNVTTLRFEASSERRGSTLETKPRASSSSLSTTVSPTTARFFARPRSSSVWIGARRGTPSWRARPTNARQVPPICS